jgi:hypothetical protein
MFSVIRGISYRTFGVHADEATAEAQSTLRMRREELKV